MIQKIKNHLLLFSSALMLLVPAIVPTIAASAQCSNIANSVYTGASSAANNGNTEGSCDSTTGVSDHSIYSFASSIVNLFSLIVGIVAVIMIIYGGFRYITSGGDSGGVGNAKNTLIYAIIGLIIVALAQLIVHFVLNQTSNITT